MVRLWLGEAVERAVEDLVAAKCEYVIERGAFREDVDDFVSRSIIESLVVPGRTEVSPRKDVSYEAFIGVSGGKQDDPAIAVAHREHGKIIIDCLRRYAAPHRPQDVVAAMVRDVIKRYHCDGEAAGDWHSAGWVRTEFEQHGIRYVWPLVGFWNGH